jgi:hypothetical protein
MVPGNLDFAPARRCPIPNVFITDADKEAAAKHNKERVEPKSRLNAMLGKMATPGDMYGVWMAVCGYLVSGAVYTCPSQFLASAYMTRHYCHVILHEESLLRR